MTKRTRCDENLEGSSKEEDVKRDKQQKNIVKINKAGDRSERRRQKVRFER